jgi:hypothetical protein
MSRIKTRKQDSPAHQLTKDIQAQSAEILQEVAELLAAIPDEELFGDNEFVIRNKVLKIVAAAYQTRIDQKKTATTRQASTVRTAAKPLVFTITADEPS